MGAGSDSEEEERKSKKRAAAATKKLKAKLDQEAADAGFPNPNWHELAFLKAMKAKRKADAARTK